MEAYHLSQGTEILPVERSNMGYFDMLNNDTLSEFLQRCDVSILRVLACTCRALCWVIDDEELWKRYAKKRYKGDIIFRGTWKRSILELNSPVIKIVQKIKPVNISGCFRRMNEKRQKNWRKASIDITAFNLPFGFSQIDKVDARTLSVEDFNRLYDIPQRPVILMHAIDHWNATHNWNYDFLRQKTGNLPIRAGTGFRMTLENYFRYMKFQKDAAPLYLFDGNLEDRAPMLLEDWDTPVYFQNDYYSRLTEDDRPPWRWIIIGPARTGAPWHVDPYLAPAWNAVIDGRKRWAIYPPGKQPIGVGDPDSRYYESPRPAEWFRKYFHTLPAHERPIEFMLEKGELLYLPAGWWHQVINITDTIAVTQCFVTPGALPCVYKDIKKNKRFWKKFDKQVILKDEQAIQILKSCGQYDDSDDRYDSSSSDSDSDSD